MPIDVLNILNLTLIFQRGANLVPREVCYVSAMRWWGGFSSWQAEHVLAERGRRDQRLRAVALWRVGLAQLVCGSTSRGRPQPDCRGRPRAAIVGADITHFCSVMKVLDDLRSCWNLQDRSTTRCDPLDVFVLRMMRLISSTAIRR